MGQWRLCDAHTVDVFVIARVHIPLDDCSTDNVILWRNRSTGGFNHNNMAMNHELWSGGALAL